MRYGQLKGLIMGISVAIFMTGCGENKIENRAKVGYLVNPTNSNIHYSCGNKEATLKGNGKFNCSSFPITFYSNNTKLGSISTLHGDGYVFPQDIKRDDIVEVKFMRVASIK